MMPANTRASRLLLRAASGLPQCLPPNNGGAASCLRSSPQHHPPSSGPAAAPPPPPPPWLVGRPRKEYVTPGLGAERQRPFSSVSRTSKRKPCPYRTLGIPAESTYAAVKKSFLKIAMEHHPDVVGKEDEERKKKSVDLFMRSRKAFEAIVEVEGGMSALREEVESEEKIKSRMTDEEFDAWFLSETGHNNPFQFDLDPATMREVAEMTEEIGGGLDRDGGMWHLAKMVTQSVRGGKEAASILRLEAGATEMGRQEQTDGVLRRRRRRPGR